MVEEHQSHTDHLHIKEHVRLVCNSGGWSVLTAHQHVYGMSKLRRSLAFSINFLFPKCPIFLLLKVPVFMTLRSSYRGCGSDVNVVSTTDCMRKTLNTSLSHTTILIKPLITDRRTVYTGIIPSIVLMTSLSYSCEHSSTSAVGHESNQIISNDWWAARDEPSSSRDK